MLLCVIAYYFSDTRIMQSLPVNATTTHVISYIH